MSAIGTDQYSAILIEGWVKLPPSMTLHGQPGGHRLRIESTSSCVRTFPFWSR
jgi:hypothetical protein